jgi:hypothetical protein
MSMVAMFGHVGDFDKAMSMMGMISLDPCHSPDLLLALLGACQKWGNAKLGFMAFNHLLQLDHVCATSYLLLANIFAMEEIAGNVRIMQWRCSFPS